MNVFDFYTTVSNCLNYVNYNYSPEVEQAGVSIEELEEATKLLPSVFQQYFIPEKPIENRDELKTHLNRLIGALFIAIPELKEEPDLSDQGLKMIENLDSLLKEALEAFEKSQR